MSGFDIDLAGLNLTDDLNIGVENPEEYQDQTAPAPPREGNYLIRVSDFGVATEFGSQTKPQVTKTQDGREFPVFQIKGIEILEPEEVKRTVRMNQNIKTAPMTRTGAKGETLASEFADFIRAFDARRAWRGIKDSDGELPSGLEVVKEFLQTGATLRARGTWKAYDKNYADAAIEAAGGRNNVSKEEMGKIINKATIRGMKKFPLSKGGSYVPEIVGPSGSILKAKFVLSFYPSTDEKVKLGLF